ncbi:MAG: DUF935 family protein [Balneolales bacterium]
MKYPINKYNSPISRELRNEVATRDATFYISVLNALPNPDPILRKTGGRIQTYRELSADWEVFSAIELIHSGIKELEWEMVPGDAPAEQVKFIEELVKQWDPYDIMTQCIDARNFGYQPFENIWHPVDGRWLITKIVSKPPEWFNYSIKNELQFISKENPQGKVIEDPRKFIVARNRPSYNNPYGESHYSRCFWPVTFKKGGITFMVKFLEKYGMPWLIGKQPRGTGKKETNKFLSELHQMIADAVSIIPDDSSVEPLDTGTRSSSTDSYLKFIHYCDSVINKVILSNELSMGASKQGGSDVRGNAQSNMQVSRQVIKSVATMGMFVINEAIQMVWGTNFSSVPPEISIYAPKDVQLELAKRDEILGRTGVQFKKKYFVNNFALGEDEFDLVDPQQQPQPGMPPRPTPRPAPEPDPAPDPDPEETEDEFTEHVKGCQCGACIRFRETHPRPLQGGEKPDGITFQEDPIEENSLSGLEALDDVIEAAAGEEAAEVLHDIMTGQLAPVFELINNAGGYQEVMTSLAGLFPEMNTEQLEDRLAKAYFIADIIGRLTEQENQEIEDE